MNFPGDPYPIHIDATFVPVKPGVVINNPNRKLNPDQKKIFLDNGWEIVEARAAGAQDPSAALLLGVCGSPRTSSSSIRRPCASRPAQPHQQEQLSSLGFEIIPCAVPRRVRVRRRAASTALRPTSTAKARCEDDFPKQ